MGMTQEFLFEQIKDIQVEREDEKIITAAESR
jgi:hypothetical protein